MIYLSRRASDRLAEFAEHLQVRNGARLDGPRLDIEATIDLGLDTLDEIAAGTRT